MSMRDVSSQTDINNWLQLLLDDLRKLEKLALYHYYLMEDSVKQPVEHFREQNGNPKLSVSSWSEIEN